MTEQTVQRDIHTWFGLTYSSYLILEQDQLARAGVESEYREKLAELERAFAHIEVPQYQVRVGEWREIDCMTDEELKKAGVTRNEPDGDEGRVTYNDGNDELAGYEDAFLPLGALDPSQVTVVSRTLLQSMPESWQYDFVALLERTVEGMTDADRAREYDVRPGRWVDNVFHPLHRDPIPHYNRGRARVEPRL